jgi:pteridine reductase
LKSSKSISTIFITGGAKRIGAFCAEYFAMIGCDLILHYNNSEQEALSLKNNIENKYKTKVTIYKADLSNEEECYQLAETISKNFENIDLLVNNASSFINEGVNKYDKAIWDLNFSVNLKAPYILSIELAKLIRNSPTGGSIVNIIDYAVASMPENFNSYHLSKVALAAVTKKLALTLAPDIRVNAIAPGYVLPPSKNNDHFAKIISTSPLQIATPLQDIADAISFLHNTRSITGQILYLDGGANIPKINY